MTNLLHLSIPLLGTVFAQRDTITRPRFAAKTLSSAAGRELLLCMGSLRVYLTPLPSRA